MSDHDNIRRDRARVVAALDQHLAQLVEELDHQLVMEIFKDTNAHNLEMCIGDPEIINRYAALHSLAHLGAYYWLLTYGDREHDYYGEDDVKDNQNQTSQPKRKRGRPKKEKTDDEHQNSQGSEDEYPI